MLMHGLRMFVMGIYVLGGKMEDLKAWYFQNRSSEHLDDDLAGSLPASLTCCQGNRQSIYNSVLAIDKTREAFLGDMIVLGTAG